MAFYMYVELFAFTVVNSKIQSGLLAFLLRLVHKKPNQRKIPMLLNL